LLALIFSRIKAPCFATFRGFYWLSIVKVSGGTRCLASLHLVITSALLIVRCILHLAIDRSIFATWKMLRRSLAKPVIRDLMRKYGAAHLPPHANLSCEGDCGSQQLSSVWWKHIPYVLKRLHNGHCDVDLASELVQRKPSRFLSSTSNPIES
jgi:hypothetical protein